MSDGQNLKPQIDVVCIGNAILDLLLEASEDVLIKFSMTKGSMSLVDLETVDKIYKDLGPGIETSGGSAANTAAGLALLGARGAYIGKVHDDYMGRVFLKHIRSVGVEYSTPVATKGPSTACCLILVTPDAERTMNTYLGASADLDSTDIDPLLICRSKIVYLEGYLWDRALAKKAFLEAARLANEAGIKVALTLSDSFCVERHRESFLNLIKNHVDILFANESEIMSLYQTDILEDAFEKVSNDCKIVAITRSHKGSVVINDSQKYYIKAEEVAEVIDTTGAGDQYAAGFLYGFIHNADLITCAKIGSITAAEVISHFGPRPNTNLIHKVNFVLNDC
jgi:sugar/nucleoside kinase (ribokinase family)